MITLTFQGNNFRFAWFLFLLCIHLFLLLLLPLLRHGKYSDDEINR